MKKLRLTIYIFGNYFLPFWNKIQFRNKNNKAMTAQSTIIIQVIGIPMCTLILLNKIPYNMIKVR